MASGFQKGIGLGATGAGIGASFGGPIGAGVGGGLGLLAGLFMGGDQEVEPYQAPSFSDINLKKENPDLYKELMVLKQQETMAEDAYNARRAGPTALEQQQIRDAQAGAASNASARGLLGTSVGQSSQQSAENRIRNEIMDRAYQEAQQLQGVANQRQLQYMQGLGGAQNAVMQNKLHEAEINHGQAIQEDQAGNQFYSGLFNAGLSGIANGLNSYNYQNTANANPYSMPKALSQGPNDFASHAWSPTAPTPPIPYLGTYMPPASASGPMFPQQLQPGYGVYAPGYPR